MVGISTNWHEDVVAVLTTINALLGQPHLVKPIEPFTAESIIAVAESLMRKEYSPSRWFAPGKTPASPVLPSVRREVPVGGERYWIPRIQAINPEQPPRSGPSGGGIIYEDPFWFLLAAFTVGQTGRLSILTKGSPAEAWARRASALKSLRAGKFHPDEHFAEVLPLGPGNTLPADLIELDGADLLRIQVGGSGLVNQAKRGPTVLSLYSYK